MLFGFVSWFFVWEGFGIWEGEDVQVLNPLKAPNIKNIFVSAVASSGAVGTLETRISCAVHACTSIWSYPAPACSSALPLPLPNQTLEI